MAVLASPHAATMTRLSRTTRRRTVLRRRLEPIGSRSSKTASAGWSMLVIMATWEDVVVIGTALPEVEEST